MRSFLLLAVLAGNLACDGRASLSASDAFAGDGGTSLQLACRSGESAKIATSPDIQTPLVTDASAVYWGVSDGIWKIAAAGGSIVQLVSGAGIPYDIALGSKDVFWTTGYWNDQSQILAVPKGGGSSRELWSSKERVATSIAVDDSHIFWISGDQHGSQIIGAIHSMPKEGGAVTLIASAESDPQDLTVDRTHVFWLNLGNDSEMHGRSVRKAPKTGGPPETLSSTPHSATGDGRRSLIALDETFVYWLDPGEQVIRKVPKAGGKPTTLVWGLNQPRAIGTAEGSLYYSDDGRVGRIASTGERSNICQGQSCLTDRVWGIAVGVGGVFLTDGYSTSSIVRICP